MIDFLERVSDQMLMHFIFLALVGMINCLAIWVLQSRYILLVSDEDLYGKDSEYDGDD